MVFKHISVGDFLMERVVRENRLCFHRNNGNEPSEAECINAYQYDGMFFSLIATH